MVLRVRRGRGATDGGRDDRADAVGRDCSAHHRVEIGTGHLGDRLDVSHVLGHEGDHGRQRQQCERDREAGPVPSHLIEVVGGELVADETVDGVSREPEPVGRLHVGPVDPAVGVGAAADLAEHDVDQPGQDIAEHQTQEDGDPAQEPTEAHGHHHHRQRGDDRHPAVGRHVDVGGHPRQVEADQHDDRTGHHRGQHLVDDPDTGEVDQHPDECEHDSGDQDRAGHVGRAAGPALVGVDGGCAADERRRGPEVARHLAVDDQQEADRGDAAHQDGQVRVEPHQCREHERGPEHRHDVLGTEPDGLAPREALVRRDGLTGFRID
jgi:hypothetical protein